MGFFFQSFFYVKALTYLQLPDFVPIQETRDRPGHLVSTSISTSAESYFAYETTVPDVDEFLNHVRNSFFFHQKSPLKSNKTHILIRLTGIRFVSAKRTSRLGFGIFVRIV